MFAKLREEARKFDWLSFALILMLLGVGLTAIYSVELSRENPDFLNFKKQIIFAAAGIFLMFGFAFANYRQLRNYSWVLVGLAVVALIAVLIFGRNIRGHVAWLTLGSYRLQPVEFAKIAFLVALAKFFSEHDMQVEPVKNILKSGVLAALFIVPVLLQPDLGSVMILGGVWFFLLIISGLRFRYIAAIAGIFLVLGVGSWFFVFKDYQRARLVTFISPASDPLGAGYNISQATIAIGSGKIWGRGIGFGSQSQLRFLPESQTDFIFAVIAEEMGFAILALILGFFVFYFYRGIKIARLARDNFTSFLAVGAVIFFAVQNFINLGMNMGVMPVTGVPLTFVSYGGSSLLASFALAGILQSINIRNKA